MRLYLLRHGEARSVGEAGIDRDEDRTLTAAGERQARRAAAALSAWKAGIEGILHSPLPRARQTAEIVAGEIGLRDGVREWPVIAPGSGPERVVEALAERRAGERLLLVGHLPLLGEVVAYLAWGRLDLAVPLRKTGMACLTVLELAPAPEAQLEWIASPEIYPERD